MSARAPASRVLVLPNQSPGVGDAVGLTRRQLDGAAWAVEPNGRLFAGAAAINRVLLALGFPWAALARLFQIPPARWLEERLYDWVAGHRSWLSRFWSARPACESEACE